MHFVLKLSTFLQQKYIIMYPHPPQLETERRLGQRQIIGRVVQAPCLPRVWPHDPAQ